MINLKTFLVGLVWFSTLISHSSGTPDDIVSGIEDWKKVDDFFWEKKRLLGDQSRTRIPARQDGHDDSVSRQDGTLHAEFSRQVFIWLYC
ncbi:hypothetical protein PCANC_02715 [Puccinia coronata f. sp. avenae]|uniref:Uncharacterized protein n=1 Tax=Puccinia coronata f. sp. avenae TaxID=200324 RepID=A0A2N5VY72_9BASI|nr:hypothetical protein PCANC_02715 [Puccinia coronata f. sp. avenae]